MIHVYLLYKVRFIELASNNYFVKLVDIIVVWSVSINLLSLLQMRQRIHCKTFLTINLISALSLLQMRQPIHCKTFLTINLISVDLFSVRRFS